MDAVADPLDIALGRRIRLRRRHLRLTQSDLGARLDVSYQQIQKYERGVNRISFSTLVRVAETLECRVADLIGDLDDPSVASVPITAAASQIAASEMNELLSAYGGIHSKSVRRSILKLATALSKQTGEDGA